MRYINPLDHGATVFNSSATDGEKIVTGINNRNVIRSLLDNTSWWRYRFYCPDPVNVEMNQKASGVNPQGPWLMIPHDFDMFGDDPEYSGLIFTRFGLMALPTNDDIDGIRCHYPNSVRMERCRIKAYHPMGIADGMGGGIIFGGKPASDVSKTMYVELDDAQIDGFRAGVLVPAGAKNTDTNMAVIVKGSRSSIEAELVGLAMYAEPLYAKRKRLEFGAGAKIGTKMIAPGATPGHPGSSHCMYIHGGCNFDIDGATFHHWNSAKYGVQVWGGGGTQEIPNTQRVSRSTFETTGMGYAMVTGERCQTQFLGNRVNSRTGIQIRGDLQIADTIFRPNVPPELTGGDPNAVLGKMGISPYNGNDMSVIGTNVIFDSTEAVNYTGIELINSDMEVHLHNSHMICRPPVTPGRKPASGFFMTSSTKAAAPYVNVHLNDCSMRGYDELGNLSSYGLIVAQQGNWYLNDVGFRGDARHDRGAISVEGTPAQLTGFQGMRITNSDLSKVTRGAAIYVAPTVDKVAGDNNFWGASKMSLPAGSGARMTLTNAEYPTALIFPKTGILPVFADYDKYRVEPLLVDPDNPAPPPPPVTKITINGSAAVGWIGASLTIRLASPINFVDDPAGNIGFTGQLPIGSTTLIMDSVLRRFIVK